MTISDTRLQCAGACITLSGTGDRQTLLRNVQFENSVSSNVIQFASYYQDQQASFGTFTCESCRISGAVALYQFAAVSFVDTTFAEARLVIDRINGSIVLKNVSWRPGPSTSGDAITVSNAGRNCRITFSNVEALASPFSRRTATDFLVISTVGNAPPMVLTMTNVSATAFARVFVVNNNVAVDVRLDGIVLNGTTLFETTGFSTSVRLRVRNLNSIGIVRGPLVRVGTLTNASFENVLFDVGTESSSGANAYALVTIVDSCDSVHLSNWRLIGLAITHVLLADLRPGMSNNCTIHVSNLNVGATSSSALLSVNRNLTVTGLTLTDSRIAQDDVIRYGSGRNLSVSDVVVRNASLERAIVAVRGVSNVVLRRWEVERSVVRQAGTPFVSTWSMGGSETELFDIHDIRMTNCSGDRMFRLEPNDRPGSLLTVNNITATDCTTISELMRLRSVSQVLVSNLNFTRSTAPIVFQVVDVAKANLSRITISHFDRLALDITSVQTTTIADIAVMNGAITQNSVSAPARFARYDAVTVQRAFFSNNNCTLCSGDSAGAIRFEGITADTNMTMRDSRFVRNIGSQTGAVGVSWGRVKLENCRFEHNRAFFDSGGAGALNLVSVQGDAVVDNSVFIGNVGINGGAVSATRTTLAISGARVWDNVARNSNGGGILVRQGELTVDSSLLRNNTAALSGGAIATVDTIVKISNTDILDSVGGVTSGVVRGGAIDVEQGTGVSIVNTTVMRTRIVGGTNDTNLAAVALASLSKALLVHACICDTQFANMSAFDVSCRTMANVSNLIAGSVASSCNATAQLMPCAAACTLHVPMLTTEAPLPTPAPPQLTLPDTVTQPVSTTTPTPTSVGGNVTATVSPTGNDLVTEPALDAALLGGAIGGAIGGLLLLVLAVVGIVCWTRRRQNAQGSSQTSSEGVSMGTVTTADSFSSTRTVSKMPTIYDSFIPTSTMTDAGYEETGNLEVTGT